MILGGNALCSILQKFEQLRYPGQYKSMMMFFGVGFAVIVAFLFSLGEKKENWRAAVKSCFYFPMLAGACSTVLNFAILMLATSKILGSGVVFSGMAVGALTVTMLCDVILFRERLSVRQGIGMVLGTAALVFLNV